MSKFFLSVAGLLTLFPLALNSQSSRTPVLVELFTSEGCSSCPPADKLLAVLDSKQPVSDAQIIVLEEHVDYWDREGWHDRFSSSLYTNRQTQYGPRLKFDDPYTPQMVVDGSAQFVGNDSSKAIAAITRAATVTKIPLDLAAPVIEGNHLTGSVSTVSRAQLPRGDLYAALVELTASTEVKSGENGGKHLDHVNVVRSFQHIGKLQDLGNGPISFKLNIPSGVSTQHTRLVVFAQLPDQGAVRGVAFVDPHPGTVAQSKP